MDLITLQRQSGITGLRVLEWVYAAGTEAETLEGDKRTVNTSVDKEVPVVTAVDCDRRYRNILQRSALDNMINT